MGNSQSIFRSRRRRRLRFAGLFVPFLVPLLLPLIVQCAVRQESSPAAARSDPEVELLSDEPAVAGRPLAPAAHDDLLLEDDFEKLDPRWSDVGPGGTVGGSPPPVELVAEGGGARGIAVLSPGSGGIHARIAVARTDALLVTARVRSFSVGHDALLLACNVVDDRSTPRFVRRAVAASEGFTEWSVVLERCRERKLVQIGLVPGDRPLAIDRVEVRRLTPAEGLWLAARDDPSPLLPHGRHRVELASMDVEMEGFYVPPGATLRWRVRVPANAPRLDLATCLLGGDRGGAVEWRVVVDGVALERRAERLAAGAWDGPFSPWIVPLDRFAGREVALELRCGGDRDLLGFAGAPRVLGDAKATRPDVILISLDTLRPDRIGRRVGGRSLTPNIDRLVERGVFFSDASSTSSWTLPAQASLLTGQHPLVHGAIDSDRRIDGRFSPLLAERFREQGYATAAFTAGVFLDPRFGFARGFELYSVRDPCGVPHDVELPHAPYDPRVLTDAEIGATPDRAFDWIRRHADVPFFLFLHTYHVHEYDDDAHDGSSSRRCELIDRATAGDAKAVAELVPRYDACVAETDHDLVGGLLDLLDRLRISERTIVAVVSDHGEEFLEHGGFRHGLTLRDEVGSIVTVLAGPGVPRGARIDSPVSLTGIAPTLARLAGLPPDPRCFGRDLLLPDESGEPPAILLHLDHYCTDHLHVRGEALWLGDWQVQRMWSESGEESLSFERRDPSKDLFFPAEPAPEVRRALERRLDAEIAVRLSRAPPVSDAGEHELPEALRERLRALGYVGH